MCASPISPSSTARCLRALQEAESALTQYAHDRDQNARLRTARDRSREAAGLQTRLARGGVVSGLEVLDVERTLASAEAALAASNTKLAGDRVHRSEEHTSELQSLMRISYAVFCLIKKKKTKQN